MHGDRREAMLSGIIFLSGSECAKGSNVRWTTRIDAILCADGTKSEEDRHEGRIEK